jgi:hypothetical protein
VRGEGLLRAGGCTRAQHALVQVCGWKPGLFLLVLLLFSSRSYPFPSRLPYPSSAYSSSCSYLDGMHYPGTTGGHLENPTRYSLLKRAKWYYIDIILMKYACLTCLTKCINFFLNEWVQILTGRILKNFVHFSNNLVI